MKRMVLLAALLCAAASAAFAQASNAKASAAEAARVEGQRYVVYSELGGEAAEGLASYLDALFELYGAYFRFDPELLAGKLVVREFAGKAAFDAYLAQVAGQGKDDFVYLHYQSPERRELLVFAKDEPERSASLAHQAFVQYLKAYVQNPPLWLRDGFAVFFETARWDGERKALSFAENLAWLETVKALEAKRSLLPLARLLSLSPEESRSSLDVYYPEAWAFVSFLVNGAEGGYDRFLWDTISGLRRDASLAENQEAAAERLGAWYGKAEEAFAAYLGNRLTFPELVQAGVKGYGEKAYDASREAFESARELDPDSYVPPYYLGLIAYARGDFGLADFEYKEALRLGCDPAIGNYALGLNAYAQNRAEDAKGFLALAKEASPERYGAKVDELLVRFTK